MSRLHHLLQLRKHNPVILPSLLQCDFGNLEREIDRLHRAGARGFHLDVMDGNFVPNLTYGMPVVQAVRRLTELPLDVHLMIVQPERYLDAFFDAGADIITFHAEAVDDPIPLLQRIRERGAGAGVVINPGTPLSQVEACLELCDLLLVMSVNAGFGGQSFNPVALEKLQRAKQIAPHLLLEIDGGVNRSTIRTCAEAGAQLFVVGSALFSQPDYEAILRELTALATIHPAGSA